MFKTDKRKLTDGRRSILIGRQPRSCTIQVNINIKKKQETKTTNSEK